MPEHPPPDPQPEPPVGTPLPLAYESSRKPPPVGKLTRAWNAMIDGFRGFVLLVIASAFVFGSMNSGEFGPTNSSEAHKDHLAAVVYFLLAAAVGWLSARRAFRPDLSKARRGFSAASLIGIGLAMLLEGICFATK